MLFRAENITKKFTEKFVLRNFSFEINKGDKINISGRSGIGKTTLFRTLMGFEMPDEGNIYFEDKPLNGISCWEVRKQIAYVSQDLNIGRGTVNDLFHETLHYKANAGLKQDSSAKIKDFLAFFQLPENIVNNKLEELSGGEKQRIAIINALLLNRKIFFLDEVTSALDQVLKQKVLDYFLSNQEFTVLYISHDNYLPANVSVKTIQLHNHE